MPAYAAWNCEVHSGTMIGGKSSGQMKVTAFCGDVLQRHFGPASKDGQRQDCSSFSGGTLWLPPAAPALPRRASCP